MMGLDFFKLASPRPVPTLIKVIIIKFSTIFLELKTIEKLY